MRTKLALCLLLFLTASRNSIVFGESSTERERLTGASLGQGLEAKEVPLLEVLPPAGGRKRQLELLQEVLSEHSDRRIQTSNPGRVSVSDRSTVVFAKDDSWYLEVMDDGSRFRYHGNIDDPAEEKSAGTSRQLDLATLERLGRDFIAHRLGRIIPPMEGERLVFLGARYLREGSATESEPFTSEVKANMAIFGREVGGIFVAGPGSKITIWFSNAGEAVGFFADWPRYHVSNRTQPTLDISEIRGRMNGYADHPLELIQRNLKHFECGYVDLGAFKRKMGLIQSGCVAVHKGQEQEFKYGAIETIPIGVRVIPDAQWPVTKSIAEHRPRNTCDTSSAVCKEPGPTEEGK